MIITYSLNGHVYTREATEEEIEDAKKPIPEPDLTAEEIAEALAEVLS